MAPTAVESPESAESKKATKQSKKAKDRVSSRYRDFGAGSPLGKSKSLQSLGVPSFLFSQTAETFVGFVIICNFIVVAYETDIRAKTGKAVVKEVETLNVVFLIFYSFEAMIRIYVERWRYFRNGWNNLDFTVLIAGITSELISATNASSVSLLRICRLVRLLRSIRLLISFRELWLLIRGLLSAMRTLFWAALLILILCTLWSILAVEMIHPKMEEIFGDEDCGRCIRSFASVMEANLTIFGMISGGDDWGSIAYPIIDHDPLFAFIFITLIFVMSFGMLNLITAVIVDTAAQARQEDVEAMAQMKADEQKRARKKLELIFMEMDEDGSGGITLGELLNGADNIPEFQDTMKVFDLEKEDLRTVFEILDEQKTGSANLEEFCDLLWRMKSRDSRTTLMFLRHYVMDIRRKVMDSIHKYETLVPAGQHPAPLNHASVNEQQPHIDSVNKDAMVRPAVGADAALGHKAPDFNLSQGSATASVAHNGNLSLAPTVGVLPTTVHTSGAVPVTSSAEWRGNATNFLKSAAQQQQSLPVHDNHSLHNGSNRLAEDSGAHWEVGAEEEAGIWTHESPPSRYEIGKPQRN